MVRDFVMFVVTSVWVFKLLDLKLHLAGSDYGNFLANEASPLAVATIDDKLRERLVIEFKHLRNQALKPLSEFMDYIM